MKRILFCHFLILILFYSSAKSQSSCSAASPIKIVVMGSSTAAGSGPTSIDSAWVWRYRAYLEGINPANQVINLAKGGYTTYKIMPTGYVPPGSRPMPDTARNITKAISLNPDAIIINFPSNDVSSGYSVLEQLANDDTVMMRAFAAGIPVWISTTQPKNFGVGSANTAKQIELRDSIFAKFNPYALDFWTTIADSNGQIDSLYDSGDGTHLNNAGHGILFSRVKNAMIPDSLYDPPPYVDLYLHDIIVESSNDCGDSTTNVNAIVTNVGISTLSNIPLFFQVEKSGSGIVLFTSDTIWGGISECQQDTISFSFNSYIGGDYALSIWSSFPADSNSINDTATTIHRFSGHPELTVSGDTACFPSSLFLTANSGPDDHYFWYDSDTGSVVLHSGSDYFTPTLSASDTFYVESTRGALFYKNSLLTTTASSINWNGIMIDIAAKDSIVIDSFRLKIFSTGSQIVRAFHKNGSYVGFENLPAAWSLLGEDTVFVTHPDSFITVSFDSLAINSGDTSGLYFHMANSSSNLRYRGGLSSPAVHSSPELDLISGSGIDFTFGSTHAPRDINCKVFYHFGSKPEGDCQSGRIPVFAKISQPSVNIGPDTILDINDIYTINPGGGFVSYSWSGGGSDSTLTLDGSLLGGGIYVVTVTITDSLGCSASDTAIIVFANLVSRLSPLNQGITIYPNPASQYFSWVNLSNSEQVADIIITDLSGNPAAHFGQTRSGQKINISDLTPGLYLITLDSKNKLILHFKLRVFQQ